MARERVRVRERVGERERGIERGRYVGREGIREIRKLKMEDIE